MSVGSPTARMVVTVLITGAVALTASTAESAGQMAERSPADARARELDEIRALLDGRQHSEAESRARAWLREVEHERAETSLLTARVLDALVDALFALGRGADDETWQLAERAVRIKEDLLGPEDGQLAYSLASLAWVHLLAERFSEARPVFERSLRIAEATLAPDSTELVFYLTGLANFLVHTGEHDAALPLYRRVLAIQQAVLGAEDPSLAPTLHNLGIVLQQLGNYAEALPLLERALAVHRQAGGSPSDLALHLNSLGVLSYETGDYTAAQSYYEQVLQIRIEQNGPDELEVANVLNNLGQLLDEMGDFETARDHLERALAIRSKELPEGHSLVAQSQHNLALVLRQEGQAEEAERLLRRAWALKAQLYGEESVLVGTVVENLAELKLQQGDDAEARDLYQEALRIWSATLAPDHLDIARCWNGLGVLDQRSGAHAAAIQRFESVRNVRERSLGPDHPQVAETLASLARSLASTDQLTSALDSAIRAETISREHLRLTARALPEKQALRYASQGAPGLDLALGLLARRPEPEVVSQVWDALIRSRALVLEEMAARVRWSSGQLDAETAALVRAAGDASRRVANLTFRGSEAEHRGRYKTMLDEAYQDKERAERALARRSLVFRQEQADRNVGLGRVQHAMPESSCLVAFVVYDPRESPRTSNGGSEYLAFVSCGEGSQPRAIHLGSAEKIEALVEGWRDAASSSENSYREAGHALRRRIWDPIGELVPEAGLVLVVPDGALHLVNFGALPLGEEGFLVETRRVFHYLSAERDVARAPKPRSGTGNLLVMGDPDFESAARSGVRPPQVNGTGTSRVSGCAELHSLQFLPLPGTEREADLVREIWTANSGGEVRHLSGPAADEAAFKELAPHARALHLATHGFFLGESCNAAGGRGVGGLVHAAAPSLQIPAESPLLLSGLVLAGANRRSSAGEREEDGILTAEEIATLDLSNVEWAVLSACDTGSGTIRAGEGVFGLRRAFQIAGARTVIMSLWSVGDEPTVPWMTALYEAHLHDRLRTADAVRAAAVRVLEQRRVAGESTHPFFWAGFVASGDWR